jgi:SAM-dependent methyltransferase
MNAIELAGAEDEARLQLCRMAAASYRAAGRFAYHFAEFKLKVDPLFTDILLCGALGNCHDLVDLGCGQGLLAAWLDAARHAYDQGAFPLAWPAPPILRRYRGVDLRSASIRRAQAALGPRGEFQVLDIRQAEMGGADAVAILDVIHYIDFDEQKRLLHKIREALPADGTLVMRVANAGAGFSYKLAQWIDDINDLARDGRRSTFFCRSVQDWLALLSDSGFEARTQERSAGRSFSNTVLIARAA